MDRARRAGAAGGGNRILTAKWEKRRRAIHKRKLRNMKSNVDNKAPARHRHLRNNAKGKQQLEERYLEIDRENRILLDKMAFIMRNQSIDNKNSSKKYAKSLNKEQRKRELVRITAQNQAILDRIQKAEPTFDRLAMESEHRENQKRVQHMSIYAALNKGGVTSRRPARGGRGYRRSQNQYENNEVSQPMRPQQQDTKLLFMDTKGFSDGVWETCLWDGAPDVPAKHAEYVLRMTAEHTVTHQRSEIYLDLNNVKVLCSDSTLLSKALNTPSNMDQPFAVIFGGAQALLTMQLGLHLVSKAQIDVDASGTPFLHV